MKHFNRFTVPSSITPNTNCICFIFSNIYIEPISYMNLSTSFFISSCFTFNSNIRTPSRRRHNFKIYALLAQRNLKNSK
nr:MAG TPA: hypothetical protein [Caudoviricetes sp.]DAK58436.1 MAG TPA: hypothetical protein [Caudoviricetes sp.]